VLDVEYILIDIYIVFFYSAHIHAKLRQMIEARLVFRLPTIMNVNGPLTNPVKLDPQLLGVYRRDMLTVLAESLRNLGRRRAVVVNGAEYMDEASLAGENHLTLLEDGEITSFPLHPH